MQEKLEKRIIVSFIILAITILLILGLPVRDQYPLSEAKLLRAIWPLAIYFFIFSFLLKALVLLRLKWGSILECLAFCLLIYSPQMMLFFLITGSSSDLRSALGDFLWWQNLLVIFGFPLIIFYESLLLHFVKTSKDIEALSGPIKTSLFANLIDAIIRFVFFSVF